MQSETPAPASPDEPKGLPPVLPPSGRHIAQLFLVPGIIVALFVLGLLGWNRLTRSWSTPEAFLKKLDDPDADVRWPAADDLAKALLRDDDLASNPTFALDLAQRLHQALDANAAAEKSFAALAPKFSEADRAREEKALEAERVYIEFLGTALGNFTIPVGLPLLGEMAANDKVVGTDATALARRRRRAAGALASLGANLRRFDALAAEQQENVLASLDQEAGTGERGQWADTAWRLLKARRDDAPIACGVDEALDRCASDKDPFLREMAVVALNYWKGTAAENAHMEAILVKRLHEEDGQGADSPELLKLFHDDKDPARDHGVDDDPGRWRLVIRSQAMVALIRRGSRKVGPEDIAGLLDEDRQMQAFHRKNKEGQEVTDEALAHATITNALKALVDLHRLDPGRDLTALYPALDRLKNSPNVAVRAEAEKTSIALGRS